MARELKIMDFSDKGPDAFVIIRIDGVDYKYTAPAADIIATAIKKANKGRNVLKAVNYLKGLEKKGNVDVVRLYKLKRTKEAIDKVVGGEDPQLVFESVLSEAIPKDRLQKLLNNYKFHNTFGSKIQKTWTDRDGWFIKFRRPLSDKEIKELGKFIKNAELVKPDTVFSA